VSTVVAGKSAHAPPGRPQLQLALQGGGAHGAFTWGVLDRLLEEESIDIGRVSGTSAGALNGAALVCGLAAGGREGARCHLSRLWHGIATAAIPMTWMLSPLRKPGLGIWDDAMPLLSPYQTNPLALEPLRLLLSGLVEPKVLNAPGPTALFTSAVNVNTGRCRVFGPGCQSVQAVLASACAPLLFQAVQIDGQAYWDGSYAGNPALWPLYEPSPDVDILLVELTPQERDETPVTAKNILNRINEIASIQGMLAELRAIDTANRLVDGADVRLHVVSLPDGGTPLETEPSIKRTVSMELFQALRQRGHAACERWLAERAEAGSLPPPVDLAARYLERDAVQERGLLGRGSQGPKQAPMRSNNTTPAAARPHPATPPTARTP
jgi:NTE family protein